jgi:protein-S-isoprenylcysteine O-methyltransferase Ste14
MIAALLVGLGSLGSALVLARLGKSFSIMPEARNLVTGGPYAYARHPLYAVEMVTLLGTAIQFAQPWATLLAAGVVALQVTRSLFEEQVLAEAYPEYETYRRRTKRFIPGII